MLQYRTKVFVWVAVKLAALLHNLNIVFVYCKVLFDEIFPVPTHRLYVKQTLHQLSSTVQIIKYKNRYRQICSYNGFHPLMMISEDEMQSS